MNFRIILDAGHGGKDSGAVSGKYYESTATLAIAKKLEKLLLASGYKVQMTRKSNRYVTLAERCKISNEYEADLFVSIHLNSVANEKAHGVETWRYKHVSQRTRDFVDNVQTELVQATGFRDRGVKKSSVLYVLKHTKASAVLVECGFMSNPGEREKLFSDQFQKKIATALKIAIDNTLKSGYY